MQIIEGFIKLIFCGGAAALFVGAILGLTFGEISFFTAVLMGIGIVVHTWMSAIALHFLEKRKIKLSGGMNK